MNRPRGLQKFNGRAAQGLLVFGLILSACSLGSSDDFEASKGGVSVRPPNALSKRIVPKSIGKSI